MGEFWNAIHFLDGDSPGIDDQALRAIDAARRLHPVPRSFVMGCDSGVTSAGAFPRHTLTRKLLTSISSRYQGTVLSTVWFDDTYCCVSAFRAGNRIGALMFPEFNLPAEEWAGGDDHRPETVGMSHWEGLVDMTADEIQAATSVRFSDGGREHLTRFLDRLGVRFDAMWLDPTSDWDGSVASEEVFDPDWLVAFGCAIGSVKGYFR